MVSLDSTLVASRVNVSPAQSRDCVARTCLPLECIGA